MTTEQLEPRKAQFKQLSQLSLDTWDMLDYGRMANLVHYAMTCASLEGDFVEFGCYQGRTAALISAVSGRKMFLYDSFCGLPEPGAKDAGLKVDHYYKGALAADPDFVRQWFKSCNLPEPSIIPAWFSQVGWADLPRRIAFAHIDGDLYSSTTEALNLVHDKLVPKGVIVVDDYGFAALPGVQKAVDDFRARIPTLQFRRLNGIGCPAQQCILGRWPL